MGNYDIETETRELKVQWVKVLPLTHAGGEPTADLPPPYAQIKFITGGTMRGRKIYMGGELISAVDARNREKIKHGD